MVDSYQELAQDPFYKIVFDLDPANLRNNFELLGGNGLSFEVVTRLKGDFESSNNQNTNKHLNRYGKLIIKALHGLEDINAHIDNEVLEEIEADEFLMTGYLASLDHRFLEFLSIKYSLHIEILKYLVEADWKIYKWLLSERNKVARFEYLGQRIRNRLSVNKKNRNVLERMLEDFNVEKEAFFDVGCLFGLSMVSASDLGFEHVHGCEVDPKVFTRAQQISRLAESIPIKNFKYFEGDFLELDVPENFYSLVVVNNVLEHTSDVQKTIAGISRILKKGGMCYIYQGNGKSISFARVEPHYKLPALTLLPRPMAIKVLLDAGRLANKNEYVVNVWPTYQELLNYFEQHGFDVYMPEQSLEYFGSAASVDSSKFDVLMKTLRHEAKSKLGGFLSEADAKEVGACMDRYEAEVKITLKERPESCKMAYFKPTWDIILTKK